jgi:radical SAM protein with 4Fe4S-binding SPASM domain
VRDIIDAIDLRPKTCVWELTARCNMRCLHCASDLGEGRTRGTELTLDEARDACRQLKALGCEQVVLSGGEALLRPDWDAIARELVQLGVGASLISNGLAIDEAIARRVVDVGICRVALSLDGPEAIHNRIRRHPRAFEGVSRACAVLKSLGLQVNIVTHVNHLNLSALPAVEALVLAWRADVWRLQLASPIGRLSHHPELQLEPEEVPSVADFIVAARRRGRPVIDVCDNVGYFSRQETELRRDRMPRPFDFWCGCSAGCLTIGIEASGNVKGCLSLQSEQFVEGNLREQSLEQIWRKPGAFAYTRQFRPENLHGYCADCEYGEICRGGCTFMAVGATGSPHNNPYCLHRLERTTRQSGRERSCEPS